FPMLSDPGGKIGSLYDVYDEKGGVNVRGRFLIDPDGVIQSMEILSPPVGRNTDELIRQIKAYQHQQKTGEVIPAGWQPGDSTLTPSTKLAGNVWKVWKPKKK
ncbi:MAG: redoxin domain-containing protein, partial [Candidatus Contubernalis sp.]|nr:redoxin domain-containing protein [Candidatus Contubernalis sp.]